MEVPSAKAANKHALIVWLLEPGTLMEPERELEDAIQFILIP